MNPMLQSEQLAISGKGALCVVGNHGGGKLNIDMDRQVEEMEDIETAKVIVSDHIASAGPEEAEERRCVENTVFLFKIAGAASDAGHGPDVFAELGNLNADG